MKISSNKLVQAAKIQKSIEDLQVQLDAILSDKQTVVRVPTKAKKHTMSKKGREAVAKAQRDRHAKARLEKIAQSQIAATVV